MRSDAAPLLRVRIAGLLGALIAALLLAAAGERVSRPLFDAYQRFAPRDLSGTRVHVVIIDPESIAALGAWPWPRTHLARLVDRIAAGGAAAIGLDILFPEPDRVSPAVFAGLYPELSRSASGEIGRLVSTDQAFSDVLGRHKVVLARAGVSGEGSDPGALSIEADFVGALPGTVTSYPRAIANIFELESVAIGHGLVNGAPDEDAVVRGVPLVASLGGRPMPGLDLEVARVAAGADTIHARDGTLRIGARTIPIGDDGRMLIRFGDFPPGEVSFAADILRRGGETRAFAGKAVLVGLAAEGTADVVATPMASEGFGVFVRAQALDAILRGEGWLVRPRWATPAEWTVGALLVLAALIALPRPGRAKLALAGAAITLPALSWLLFDRAALLVDPLKPLALGAAASLGLAGAMFGRARVERERLREALVAERVAAAAIEAELDTARAIQIGMLPTAATLAALDSRVEVAARLEPARAVGGDFYDAMVSEGGGHLLFCIADVTGKGVPASLFMAVSKALAKSVVLREPDLAAAAAELNRELSRDNAEALGVTMLLGSLEIATGDIAFVNAGHEDPLLLRADGRLDEIRLEGGPPFCILDYPWPVERIRIAPGETIVLITDGVTEAQDGKGALFGRERTLETLGEPSVSAGGVVVRLVDAVRAFEGGAEASDDLTVLALRYRGAAAPI